MKVINQRELYLEQLKLKSRKFWRKVVELYNQGTPVPEIAKKFINPRTGKPYSRQHIHAILKYMRDKVC